MAFSDFVYQKFDICILERSWKPGRTDSLEWLQYISGVQKQYFQFPTKDIQKLKANHHGQDHAHQKKY